MREAVASSSFGRSLDRLIELAIDEDVGSGDITTDWLIPPGTAGRAVIRAKEPLVACGLSVGEAVFKRFDPYCDFKAHVAEGDSAATGSPIVTIGADMAALLTAERTALNFMQRLSGIATHVRSYVQALKGSAVRLVDTRKTIPGMRVLEKYAVRVGGAANHRMGLYDGVLIKDNHIAACGGIAAAVRQIRARVSHLVRIEVETTTFDEVREALAAGAEVIMLDNMDLAQIAEAVGIIKGRARVEVSGGVTRDRLEKLAQTGVDLISVGALTHSARAVDLSMRIEPA
jgi:nicotinate-nucleotide pyrophosphorylase (carboxylating)